MSSTLVPLELCEASYYKATPNRLFCFKWSKKDKTKVQPVFITHDQVQKHYPDLIDPPADSKWAEMVKGKVPPGYKGPHDLQPTSGKVEIEAGTPAELAMTIQKKLKEGDALGDQDLVNFVSGQGFDVLKSKHTGMNTAFEVAFGNDWKAKYKAAKDKGITATGPAAGEVPPSKTEPEPEGPPELGVVAGKVLPQTIGDLMDGIDGEGGLDQLPKKTVQLAKNAFGPDWKAKYKVAKAVVTAAQMLPMEAKPNGTLPPKDEIEAALPKLKELTGYPAKEARTLAATAWRLGQPPYQGTQMALINGLVAQHKKVEKKKGELPVAVMPSAAIEPEPVEPVPDPVDEDPYDEDEEPGPGKNLIGFSGKHKILFDLADEAGGFGYMDEEDDELLSEHFGKGWKSTAAALHFAYDAYSQMDSPEMAEKYGLDHDDVIDLFEDIVEVHDLKPGAEANFLGKFKDKTGGAFESLEGLSKLDETVDFPGLPQKYAVMLDTLNEFEGGVGGALENEELDEFFKEHFGDDWKNVAGSLTASMAMFQKVGGTEFDWTGPTVKAASEELEPELEVSAKYLRFVYRHGAALPGSTEDLKESRIKMMAGYYEKGAKDFAETPLDKIKEAVSANKVLPIGAGPPNLAGVMHAMKWQPGKAETLANAGETPEKYLDTQAAILATEVSKKLVEHFEDDPTKAVTNDLIIAAGLAPTPAVRSKVAGLVSAMAMSQVAIEKQTAFSDLKKFIKDEREKQKQFFATQMADSLWYPGTENPFTHAIATAKGEISSQSMDWKDLFDGLATAAMVKHIQDNFEGEGLLGASKDRAIGAGFGMTQYSVGKIYATTAAIQDFPAHKNTLAYVLSEQVSKSKSGALVPSFGATPTLMEAAKKAGVLSMGQKDQAAVVLAGSYLDPSTGTISGGMPASSYQQLFGEDWKEHVAAAMLTNELMAAASIAELQVSPNWLKAQKQQLKHKYGLKTIGALNGMMAAAAAGEVQAVKKKLKKAAKVEGHWMNPVPAQSGSSVPPVGFEVPDIPPIEAMTLGANAQAQLGGNKPKFFVSAPGQPNKFLFKPGKVKGLAAQAASDLSSLVVESEHFVSSKACTIGGKTGAVQALIPNLGSVAPAGTGEGGKQVPVSTIKNMSDDQLRDLLRERVMDWAFANQDTKGRNFLLDAGNRVIGIDKEQAFLHLDQSILALGHQAKPNPTPSIYDQLFKAYVGQKVELDFNSVEPYVSRIENIPDSKWMEAVDPYLSAHAAEQGWTASQLEAKRQAVLKRKNGIRQEFEDFFTRLREARGEVAFKFKKKKPSVSPGTPAHELPVPDLKDLTPTETPPGGTAGAGIKEFYEDQNGQIWMFKLAKTKGYGGKDKPYAAAAQDAFAKIAKQVKPDHPNVGMVKRKKGGATEYGTLQPWLPGVQGSLLPMQHSPASLTDSQKADVASEHVLDWCMSQHDSHAENFMVLESGKVIGIDKEQGWRYMISGEERLDANWKPSGNYETPFYNKFWGDWSKGKFEFDPKEMAGAIEKVEAIKPDEFRESVRPYAEQRFPGDKAKQEAFIQKMLGRKTSVRRDFEVFLTGLARTKHNDSKGTFTFKDGWKPSTAAAGPTTETFTTTKSAEEVAWDKYGCNTAEHKNDDTLIMVRHTNGSDPAHAKSQINGCLAELGISPVGPTIKGSYYTLTPVKKSDWEAASVTTTETVTTQPEDAVPIHPHPGQATYLSTSPPPPAAPGNMEQLDKLINDTTDWAGVGWGGFAITGDADLIKSHTFRVRKNRDQAGKDYYTVQFRVRDKKALEQPDDFGTTYTAPWAPFDESTGVFQEEPPIGVPIAHMTSNKWETGDSEAFMMTGEVNVPGKGTEPNARAVKDIMVMKVRPKSGQSFKAAFEEMTKKVFGSDASKVLRNPSDSDKDKLRMQALLWAKSPQEADLLTASTGTLTKENVALSLYSNTFDGLSAARKKHAGDIAELGTLLRKSNPTSSDTAEAIKLLRKRLSAVGVKKEEIDATEQAEIAPGLTGPVQRGRWSKIRDDDGEPLVRYCSWALSNPKHLVNILQTGQKGPNGRIFGGLGAKGESVISGYTNDMRTGGADKITFRTSFSTQDSWKDCLDYGGVGTSGGHPINIILAPDILDRLDLVQVGEDTFGSTVAGSWTDRAALPKALKKISGRHKGNRAEIIANQAIGPNYIARINILPSADPSGQIRKDVIQRLRDAGIEDVNGVPIEDFVVSERKVGDVYSKYVKPMGYY